MTIIGFDLAMTLKKIAQSCLDKKNNYHQRSLLMPINNDISRIKCYPMKNNNFFITCCHNVTKF